MNNNATSIRHPAPTWWLRIAALCAVFLMQSQAFAADLTLTVVDANGQEVTDTSLFRWLLEEDNSVQRTPGVAVNDSISLVIHKSHAPVEATGTSATAMATIPVPDPDKAYYLSVMAEGYSVGGARVAPNQTEITVVLNKHPIPTSQISVFVFADTNSINNVPDASENGLGGFRVIILDPLGGGPQMQDAFGNPLGTTYQFDAITGEPSVDTDGNLIVDTMGDGNIYTDSNGRAQIKYIPPGKFGVQVIPPLGADWNGGHGSVKIGDRWHQTSTIEGTLTIDAWVKANEPALWVEGFGVGFYHVFFGFTDPNQLQWAKNPPPADINNVEVTGTLRYNHFGPPPQNQMFVAGPPVPEGFVALNQVTLLPGGGLGPVGAAGNGLYMTPCDDNGNFTIPNVPPGTYQLVTWDKPLDSIFGFNTVTVNGGEGTVALGDVLCYRWFGTLEGSVFYDADQDGFRDPNEAGISDMAVNLRFRDGRVYMGTVTDSAGDYEMAEVFPFFKWLTAEVDFARYKSTGLTSVTDDGGPIPPDNGWDMPSEGVRNPQPQYEVDPVTGVADTTQPIENSNTGNNLARTVVGEALVQAIHLFLNQNTRIDWGKADYAAGENGGISGIIFYAITRAEEDPRDGTGDPWEPGIPRVQVALYLDEDQDKVIDALNGGGPGTLADVDNHPLGWADGTGSKGPEDIDRNGNGTFDPGDAVNIVWSDSWDDTLPTSIETDPPVILDKAIVGADSYSTWNQTSDGVFDGGYAFGGYDPNGWDGDPDNDEVLPVGMYIVEAAAPPGYLHQTEESMNVGWGDGFVPSKLALVPECVGDLHTVPAELTLFPGVPAPFAGQQRPLPDRKWVMVSDGKNAPCDFHMYTEVPKAARVVGFVLNDLSAEFNAYSPNNGEKASPGWLPISFRDWAGNEVARTYCDEFGTYNALIPSTYTVNAPAPSGVVPNMLTVVLNDPTMPNPNFGDPAFPDAPTRIPDPHHNPNYGVAPSTWMFWSGSVSYLDTPIVPVGGFVGHPNMELDVETPDGTPIIDNTYTIDGLGNPLPGPFLANAGDTLFIASLGSAFEVPNPEYIVGSGIDATITRDYSFGPSGTVTIDGVPMVILGWTPDLIQAQLPAVLPPDEAWHLLVTRNDTAQTTPLGLTLTFGLQGGPDGATARRVYPEVATSSNPLPTPIQDAIEAANPGDLILIAKGIYNENPIVYKPVRIQGSGYGTIINANPVPADRTDDWIANVTALMGGNPFDANGLPGFLVLGGAPDPWDEQENSPNRRPRIDGCQIFGSITGGGILVYNGAHSLRISHNRINGNQGAFTGGIGVGVQGQAGTIYDNKNILIERNRILKNGSINGPGGIGIFTGAERYKILHNTIMGNFSRVNGGGIGHEGISRGGVIADNKIVNNEVFYGAAVGGDGGGIYIGGETVAGGLSTGAGSVSILNNLIQGNLAGSGRGGGICVVGFNGTDVQASPGRRGRNDWYRLVIANNMVVNNAAGYQAGGICLQDATWVQINHNTIANNECTATAQAAFPAGQSVSSPQGAGIVSYQHSALLAQYSQFQTFSNPELEDNIILHNRSFYWDGTALDATALAEASPFYQDLQVVTLAGQPSPLQLNPRYCLLSSAAGYHNSNITGDPAFASPYVNTLFAAVVLDEAGNNISIRFEPIGLYVLNTTTPLGDYHIQAGSVAIDEANNNSPVEWDYDRQPRPAIDPVTLDPLPPDIGADELSAGAPLLVDWPNVPFRGPAAEGVGVGTPAIPPPGTPILPVMQPVPPDTDGLDTDGDGDPNNDYKFIRFGAGDGFVRMGDGNELYCFGFSQMTEVPFEDVMMTGMLKAETSGPTLILREGQRVYLDIANVGMIMRPDLFDPHTLHFHGFPQAAPIFDGEPMGSVSINMGGTYRYFYEIVHPGTYMYHCHVEATEHMEMGMLGNLYVEPKQNFTSPGASLNGFIHQAGYKYAYNDGDGSTHYDVDFPLQLGAFDRKFHELHIAVQPLPFWSLDESYPMINGRGYPDTVEPNDLVNSAGIASQRVSSLITATVGQKILLRISNLSVSDYHTLTVLGIPMRIVGRDAKLLRGPTGANLTYMTTSITLGGGESADAILDTTGLPEGDYFVYDARLNHLCNDEEDFGGMMTEIHLTAP